jgi:diaminopimelate decarboxylase
MSKELYPVTSFDVAKVAKKYETPVWVYEQAILEKRAQEVQAFDLVRYAQKANSNLAILTILKNQGIKVDAVSAGEVLRAFKVGYTASAEHSDVVFTADLFDKDALKIIKEHNVPVNVGSMDLISQLADNKINVPVTLRINPGFGHGHSKKTNTGGELSKHGIWHTDIEECVQIGKDRGVNVNGLHMHIGSGADFEHLTGVCDAMVAAAKRFGKGLEVISAGGGLPVSYDPAVTERIDIERYFGLWDSARKEIEEFVGHKIALEVEPGRYLAAEAGYLVTEIRSIKKQGTKTFYLVDAGFNDLARPSMYGSFHHISIVAADGRELTKMNDVIVGGPLCESGDVFTQEEGGFVVERSLPVAKVGDFLVLHDAGAYGFAMSSNYNTRRSSAEVLVTNSGDIEVIRERQTFEALMQFEKIPDNL